MGAKHWGRFVAGSRLWTATKAFPAPARPHFAHVLTAPTPLTTQKQPVEHHVFGLVPAAARAAPARGAAARGAVPASARASAPSPTRARVLHSLNTPSLTPRARAGQQGKAGGEAAKEKGGTRDHENIIETNQPTNHSLITDRYPK